jgi:hypothetical protein
LRWRGLKKGLSTGRGTGSKPLEQQFDGANRVPQIRRIERGIKLGRAVVALSVAKCAATSQAGTPFWRIKRATVWRTE